MKLQHFAYQSKKKTKNSTNKSVVLRSFSNSHQDESAKHQIFSSEQSAHSQKLNIDSEYYFIRKIYDLVEGYTDWYIPKGNHCIIGNKNQIKILADCLMKARDGSIDLIDIFDFLQSNVSNSLLNNDIRLITIKTGSVPPELIREVISKCHQIYFYKPNNLLKYCGYTQEYYVPDHLNYLVNEIATGIGMDMKQILDILSGMLTDEFLEISSVGAVQALRRLPNKVEITKKAGGDSMSG